jgi:hypothetical protein
MLGICPRCGHAPIAQGEYRYPNCGMKRPNPGPPSKVQNAVALTLLLAVLCLFVGAAIWMLIR